MIDNAPVFLMYFTRIPDINFPKVKRTRGGNMPLKSLFNPLKAEPYRSNGGKYYGSRADLALIPPENP